MIQIADTPRNASTTEDKMMKRRGPKPQVEWNGVWYSCRSYKTEIPDLKAMSRIEALLWLNANTAPRGYQRAPNPLAGFAGALSIGAR